MTEIPERPQLESIEEGGRSGRRIEIVNQLLAVVSDQAVYIEQLELMVDEYEDLYEQLLAGIDDPGDDEPEDPRAQALRDAGVPEDMIPGILGVIPPEEDPFAGAEVDQGVGLPQSLAELAGEQRARPQLVPVAAAEPAEAAEPAPRARPKKVNPPRAGKAAPGHAQRIEIVDGADDNPFANGQIPGVEMTSPAVLNGPRKTTPPRKRSQHNTRGVTQWKRDAAGRRVPNETPEDTE